MGTSVTGTEVATAVQSQGTLALRGDQADWTPTQRAALAQIGIGDAPAGDQQVFLHVCQRSGLDPFARQAYMISRWDPQSQKNKWTIQTGIDGYRVIAERRPEYGGQLGPQWCGEDGVWAEVWTSQSPPVAARVGVIRKDWDQPVWGIAHFWEFAATKKDGQLNHMWSTKGRHQIAKCSEAAALRKAFPQDFAGIYVDDEMEHVGNPQPRVVIDAEREQPTEPDWDALIAEHETARDVGKLWDLRKLAQGMRPNDGPLLNRIAEAWQRTKNTVAAADAGTQAPAKGQMNRLFALLGEGGITSDEHRYRLASHHLDRDITSFKDLTASDVSRLITDLEKLKADGRLVKPASDTTPAETAPTATEGDNP